MISIPAFKTTDAPPTYYGLWAGSIGHDGNGRMKNLFLVRSGRIYIATNVPFDNIPSVCDGIKCGSRWAVPALWTRKRNKWIPYNKGCSESHVSDVIYSKGKFMFTWEDNALHIRHSGISYRLKWERISWSSVLMEEIWGSAL